MKTRLKLDDEKVRRVLQRLAENAADLTPAMQSIAFLGENQAREAFATETAPDGTPWKASRRKLEIGGKTLTDSGRLGDSLTSDYDADSAVWGSNLIYAAIHQNGGVIKAKNAKSLAFTGSDGFLVLVKQVTIPKRAFLPESLDEMDAEAIEDILQAHLLE